MGSKDTLKEIGLFFMAVLSTILQNSYFISLLTASTGGICSKL